MADKLDEVQRLAPDAADQLNKDAVALRAELAGVLTERKKNDDYDKLIKDTDVAFKAGQFDLANSKALEAQLLVPRRPEAGERLAQVAPKLDEAKRQQFAEKQRLERQKQFDAAFTAAAEKFKQGHLEDAEVSLKTALDLNDKHPGALALQKEVTLALQQKHAGAELQKKTEQFNALLAEADRLTEQGEVDPAGQKLAEAGKLFPGDTNKGAALQATEKKIAAKKEGLKELAGYEVLLKNAREARRAGSLDEAQKLVQSALASKVADERAKTLKKQIEDDLEERKKIANKENEYNRLVDSGNFFVKTANEMKADAYDDKITQLNSALNEFATAKSIKAEGPATTRTTEVKQIIEQLKVAATKKKAEEAAVAAKKRAEFNAQLTLADTAATKGDFPGADNYLKAAREILADADALKTLEAKKTEYQNLQKSDQAVRTAFGQVLDDLKKEPADLGAALKTTQDVCQAFPTRRDMAGVLDTLNKVKSADEAARQSAAAVSAKIAEFSRNKKLADKPELAQLGAARDRLQGLAAAAAGELAASNFQKAAAVLQDLDQKRRQAENEINTLRTKLEALGKVPAPEVQRPGELEPDADASSKKPTPPPEKKKKSQGSVGEINPFD